jgi:hypothetical protein
MYGILFEEFLRTRRSHMTTRKNIMSSRKRFRLATVCLGLLLAALLFQQERAVERHVEIPDVETSDAITTVEPSVSPTEQLIMDVIEQHPDQRISRDLRDHLASGRVVLEFYKGPVEGKMILSVAWDRTPTGEDRMHFMVLTQSFLRTRSDKPYLDASFVHEYVHVLHGIRNLVPVEIFRRNRRRYSESDVHMRYESEFDAYYEQCKFSVDQGYPRESMHGMCEQYHHGMSIPELKTMRLMVAHFLFTAQPQVYGRYKERLIRWAQSKPPLTKL